MKNTAILLISCPDQKGVTAAISEFIYRSNGNIVHADEHLDVEHDLFLLRIEWDLEGFAVDMRTFARYFEPIAQRFNMSTRIAEVADFHKSDEHELPVGNDHGYMWRLYTYWRLEEKDGGVYLQNESVALSRTVPVILAWLVNPLVKSMPRNVITHPLLHTRKVVLSPGS